MKRIIALFIISFTLLSCGADFNSEVWKNHNDLDEIDNPRWGMTKDLKSLLNKRELSEKEILNLLGEPSETHVYNGVKTLYYPIGWKSGFGIDPDFFMISIDSNGNYLKNGQEQR